MAEFLFPTYGEWLQEHGEWDWWQDYDPGRWDKSTIFTHVSALIRDLLSLPAQTDYYRPERAALVLGTLLDQPSAIKHGSVSYSAWMVRLRRIHPLTSLMGAEICRGMLRLRQELNLPGPTSGQIQGLLEEGGQLSESEPSAGEIVAEWIEKTARKTPLAMWLRQEAGGQAAGSAASAD